MKSAIEKTMRYGIALSAVSVVLMVASGGASHAHAAGNPCDIRDQCSAEPGRYAAYRDDAMVKAREYVADMNWTGGGPPDSAVVLSRVVKAYDMSGAAQCDMRDECSRHADALKVVRVGPPVGDAVVARDGNGVRVATTPAQK